MLLRRRVRGHRLLLAGRTWIRRLILWWLRASRAMIPDSLGRALVKMTFTVRKHALFRQGLNGPREVPVCWRAVVETTVSTRFSEQDAASVSCRNPDEVLRY